MGDIGVTDPLFGFYRAKVVDNKDSEKFGRVLLWIPDLMPIIEDSTGLWARPGNNPLGGRNLEDDEDQHFQGSSYIPKKGSWVFCFFEAGNINRPYYFGALDIENTTVLPENQLGTEHQDKWTILKTHEGRCIIVSDDPDDARTEITGKKIKLNNPPTGDLESVYKIDGNQTTILFDERAGKEKVLIRTHKGDFLHIDIDEQQLQAYFKGDIKIKTDKSLYLTAKEDINIKALSGNAYVQSASSSVYFKAAQDIDGAAGGTFNIKSATNVNAQAGAVLNLKAGGALNGDGSAGSWQGGAASPAGGSEDASPAEPVGERDT